MTRLLSMTGVLCLLVGVTGCVPSADQGLAPHAERRGPVGPVPHGLAEYYGQELAWGPCAGYATTQQDRAAFEHPEVECARVEVPVDYREPKGRTLSFGILRRPADDPSSRIGSLLVNPGGPGASGMSSAAGLAGVMSSSELGRRFDLVGFDPRGVASSQPPIECLTDAERDAERLDSDTDISPEGVAQTEAENRRYAELCAARTGPDVLANVGTRDVVRDMDILRSVLGDRKLNYLGFSYGTRLGAEYAEHFPGNVRAMVLDGAIDPGQTTVEATISQAAGFQRAFNDFAAWCAGQDQCALGHDPNQAVAEFQELARPLVDTPAHAGDRELSYSDATTGTIQALYAPQLWSQLNAGLRQLAQGDGRLLLVLADLYFGREPNGDYSTVTDAFDAVRCVDDQRVTDPGKLREADQRYREAAPFLDDGRGANPARDPCSFWPVPVTGDPNTPEVSGLPPVLVISTTHDPATPYEAGERLAAALGGRVLTYDGTQHTVFLQGKSCVDGIGTRYLVNLVLPRENVRCRG